MNNTAHKKTIIHVVGCGRSGSTIVDRTLGHHPQVFSIGEILNFKEDYQRNSLCGCGRKLQECAFWGEVIENLNMGAGSSAAAFVERFQLKPEAYSGMAKKVNRVKNAAGLLFRLPPGYFTDTRVYENTGRLYKEVFALSEATAIVDSSKSIVRALFLSRLLPQYEHFFIHLVRDGRGVVNSKIKTSYQVMLKGTDGSLEKQEFKSTGHVSPEAAVDDWVKVNSKVERIIGSYGLSKRSQRVHLEKFLADPPAMLTHVLGAVGLDYQPSMLTFTYGDNHMVCGNSSRLNALKLRKEDKDWDALLDPQLLAIFHARGGKKLNEKYGYQ